MKIPAEVINIPNFTIPVQSINNSSMEAINRRMMQQISKDIPFYSNPVIDAHLSQKILCQNSQKI